MQTYYVKPRLGTTTVGESYSLHQSLMSASVLTGMTESFSYCSHTVSIHFVMDIVSLSTSHPLWFLFFLSLSPFPQGLNYPVFFKVT